MANLGPMVVVADRPASELAETLGKAGAFPVVESRWADAPAAIAQIRPVAIAIGEAAPQERLAHGLHRQIAATEGPLIPVLALVEDGGQPPLPDALPCAAADSVDLIIGRLRSALRVRSLHATVVRRATARGTRFSAMMPGDLLGDATVLCFGRGRSYPALSVAIGEQVGVVGALSLEAAAHYLNARDIDGIVIGDGFGSRMVEALLTVLAEDARFRDHPIGVLGPLREDFDGRLPNLVRVEADPARLVAQLMPYVRMQAFEARLKRMLTSLDSKGLTDPDSGLLSLDAFWRDLDLAVRAAADASGSLSVARFAFMDLADRRASLDAARLFGRLMRSVDFACRDADGSIIAVFTETDLRSAHVIARRIASALRHTMLSPDLDRRSINPTITLATLKPADSLDTLAARISAVPIESAVPTVAAE